MIKLLCLFALAIFVSFLPVHRADATTWQTALSNCEADAAAILARGSTGPTGACINVPSESRYNMVVTFDGYPNGSWCSGWGLDPTLPCTYDDGGPPDCSVKAGRTLPPGTSYDSFPDGTACEDYCSLGLLVGGSLSGYMVYNGQMCPFVSTTDPAPIPKVQPLQVAPPECNADGSCVSCSGTTCATTGATTPQAPPPATGSSSGNHTTNTNTSTTNNYSQTTTTTVVSGGSTGGTGDSTSTTTGTGTGTSDSKCDSGACDVGEADGDVGGLYQSSGQTPASVYRAFVAQVQGSPIVSAAGGFFNVQAGGSCPSWHIPGNQFWGAAGFDFSFFCSSAMLALFQLAGYLVLAGAAFCAFRIAIY